MYGVSGAEKLPPYSCGCPFLHPALAQENAFPSFVWFLFSSQKHSFLHFQNATHTQHYPRSKQRGNAPVHRLIEGGTKDFTFFILLFVLCWRGTPRGGPRGLHKCCWAALQNCCCNPLLQRIQNTNRTSDTLARLLNNETLH